MQRIFLGLGSNLGDGPAQIAEAVSLLQSAGIALRGRSRLYHTEPVGFSQQPWFTNAVIEVSTTLSPEELLRECQAVESRLDRQRLFRNGPRTIDIDLLLWGDEVRATPELQLPHPRFRERGFVLEPLAELAPELSDPVTGKTFWALLAELALLPDQPKVHPLCEEWPHVSAA